MQHNNTRAVKSTLVIWAAFLELVIVIHRASRTSLGGKHCISYLILSYYLRIGPPRREFCKRVLPSPRIGSQLQQRREVKRAARLLKEKVEKAAVQTLLDEETTAQDLLGE
jgi:hypothetical protein